MDLALSFPGPFISYHLMASKCRKKRLVVFHFYPREDVFHRRAGVVGGVPAFQHGGPGSIPGGVRNFNSYPGIGCVSFVFCPVLSPTEALTLC